MNAALRLNSRARGMTRGDADTRGALPGTGDTNGRDVTLPCLSPLPTTPPTLLVMMTGVPHAHILPLRYSSCLLPLLYLPELLNRCCRCWDGCLTPPVTFDTPSLPTRANPHPPPPSAHCPTPYHSVLAVTLFCHVVDGCTL